MLTTINYLKIKVASNFKAVKTFGLIWSSKMVCVLHSRVRNHQHSDVDQFGHVRALGLDQPSVFELYYIVYRKQFLLSFMWRRINACKNVGKYVFTMNKHHSSEQQNVEKIQISWAYILKQLVEPT